MELSPIELVLGLLVVAVALGYVARRIGVAYPILLLLGGLVLGFLPGLPSIELDPDVVFLLLLPPILFGAGYSTPIRDFKANRAADRAAGGRPRAVHDGRRRAGRHRRHPGPAAGGGLRARRHRRAAGRGRRDGDLPPARGAAGGSSRSSRARAWSTTRRRSSSTGSRSRLAMTGLFSVAEAGLSFVFVGAGGILVGVIVGYRGDRGLAPDVRPDARDHGLAARAVRRLPAGRGARRERRPGDGRRRADRRPTGRPRRCRPTARLMGRGVWDIVIVHRSTASRSC